MTLLGRCAREPSYFSASTAELFFAGIYRHVTSTHSRLQYPSGINRKKHYVSEHHSEEEEDENSSRGTRQRRQFDLADRMMKVEGVVASITVPHKIKVKEEAKECCGYQQITTSATSASAITTTTATTIATATTTLTIATAATTTVAATTTSVSSISTASATSSTSFAISNPPIDSGTTSINPTTISPTTSTIVHSPTPHSNLPVLSPSSTTSSISSSAVVQASNVICQLSPTSNLVTMVNKSSEPFPVDLDLKTKIPQVLPNGPSPSREKTIREEGIESHCASRESRLSPCSINKSKPQYQANGNLGKPEYVRGTGGETGHYVSSGSSESEIPISSHNIKPENVESPTPKHQQLDDHQSSECNAPTIGNGPSTAANRSVAAIFAGHGKLKRLLGTLIQFASNISQDTGESVRALILGLLSGAMTAEEFHSALQEATNFPLRGFVLPYLRHTLPSLRRDLTAAARASNQTCVQYFRTNESVILETVSLAPSSDTVDLFGDHNNAMATTNLANHCTTGYGIMRSGAGIGPVQHPNNNNTSTGGGGGSLHQHYSNTPTNLATKRRASDTPYFENGGSLDEGPIYGKRSSNPWNHHSSHQQQQQPGDSYCWYPLHSSSGTLQSHSQSHSHGPSPVPPGLVQVNQLTSFGPPQLPHQQQQLGHVGAGGQMQNGASLDDEWKNIHVMLNCILGMVEKTKRALAILQRRGSPSPAATAPPLTPGAAVGAQNGASNGNPTSSNGAHVESSTGDRDAGNLKRLSGEIVAQTIRATEDRVAEVKRRAEEAVQEVKRAAVAEVQRAVAVAVAESRANERLRVHRLLDLPLPHRNHAALRQTSFIRVAAHINPNNQEATGRTGSSGTPTTTSGPAGAPDEEKDVGHLASVVGSGCWNCGRTALETCGGCGVARYCGSFCQHRDWEAGGHHATCNSSPSRERPRRSSSQSPTRNLTVAANSKDNENNATSAATVAK
ncbi:protein CBFA2T2 isoform X2 [Venturia canescens]|uniref:protein CBFA2T2 isoform X2 n=1 Tax=Venturia canescens TaxID=32260 RepID=UPI001C9CE501|nr:protein CBFA2T2 isoform X2 [Venturia canescens]